MRASTLFALTVAVLIGLGVAIAAKLGGYFSTPPPVEPPAKRPDIMILAAAHNLFAGDLIDVSGVRVRALKPEEFAHYDKNRDQYLPALQSAAALRITRRNIYADEPILKECLQEMARPEALHSRLLPQMRAVNLSLTKEHSAGGLIQVGDWVDVFLTSKIDNAQEATTTRTACIIPKVRVIAKRNSLWPIFAPLPDDKPVNFTLEVNPYRAALLEFSRAKGLLTMAPLPLEEKHNLETRRGKMLESATGIRPVHFLKAGTPDANAEDERVAGFARGELVVSEFDLIRIFGLTTPPPPTAPISVERIGGIYRYEPAVFTADGIPVSKNARSTAATETRRGAGRAGIAAPAFQFSDPSDCPNCSKRAEKGTR
jgi:Flp pilus assembly protein CpaB